MEGGWGGGKEHFVAGEGVSWGWRGVEGRNILWVWDGDGVVEGGGVEGSGGKEFFVGVTKKKKSRKKERKKSNKWKHSYPE